MGIGHWESGLAVIGAMIVSLYQANLARAQLRASAWPYLSQGNCSGTGNYQWVVANDGIGPAKVGSFRVTVDGHPTRTWNAAVSAGSRIRTSVSVGDKCVRRGCRH